MKKALFLLLDEFADWEASYLSSTLNQHENWSISTISTEERVSSIGGFSVLVDYTIGNEPQSYDLLVMVGGNSWDDSSKELLTFVKNAFNENIIIGAICGAVDYLARYGFLNDSKHTGNSVYEWRNYENYQPKYEFIEKQCVRDKSLITANGTATLEFTELTLKAIEFDTDESIEKIIYMNKYGFYSYCEKYGSPFV